MATNTLALVERDLCAAFGGLFADLREDTVQQEQWLEGAFRDLDQLRADLERQAIEVTEQFEQLDSERKELSIERLAIAAELDVMTAERDRLLADNESLQARQPDLHERADLADQIAQLSLERDELTRQLAEFGALQAQLQSATQELAQHRGGEEESRIQCALAESELEQVRIRASELSDEVDVLRRELADERSRGDALERARSALEQCQTPHPIMTPESTSMESEAPTRKEQRVIGSIQAQFERIRSERGRR